MPKCAFFLLPFVLGLLAIFTALGINGHSHVANEILRATATLAGGVFTIPLAAAIRV